MALIDKIGVIEDVHGMSPWVMPSLYSLLEQRRVNTLVLNGDNVDPVQITEDTYNKFGDLNFCRSLGMDVDNKPLLGRNYQEKIQRGEQSQEFRLLSIIEALENTNLDIIINFGNHDQITSILKASKRGKNYSNVQFSTNKQYFKKDGYEIVVVPGSHTGGQIFSNYENLQKDSLKKIPTGIYIINKEKKLEFIPPYDPKNILNNPKKIQDLMLNIDIDPIKQQIKDPKKTILFTHDPSKGEHKNSPDVAHFVEKYIPEIHESKVRWRKEPGFLPLGYFAQIYQQEQPPFIPLQEHEEDYPTMKSKVKEIEKMMLGEQPDPRRLQPVYIERETNVGEQFITDFKEETGIEKEFCGHIHGTSGIAVDKNGNKVDPNTLTDNIQMNAGTLDGGYLTIIDVHDDGKVSYETLDWRKEIGVNTIYNALSQDQIEAQEILSEYKGENICDLILKKKKENEPIPINPKQTYLDEEEKPSGIILPTSEDMVKILSGQ